MDPGRDLGQFAEVMVDLMCVVSVTWSNDRVTVAKNTKGNDAILVDFVQLFVLLEAKRP